MRIRIFSLALLLALVLTACAPDPTATPTLKANPSSSPEQAATAPAASQGNPIATSAPPGATIPPAGSLSAPAVSGKFTYAPGDGSIWVQDASTGQAQALVTATADAFADAPAFSPDGQRVAYTLSTLTAQGVAQNAIHLIDVEGKNEHALAIPPDIKTSFNWPAYSPDGQWVYYTSSYPVPPNSEHSEIQRVPVQGGTPSTIISDARTASLSSDGRRLAFLRFNFDTYTAALWIADSTGAQPRRLVADDVFALISPPRFSPDGQWLLFAASGPPSHPLPGASLCEPRLLCRLAQPAYADGLPWDLWLVSVDGAHFQQLTKIGSDSPAPAWSRDGKQVSFFDIGGIYLVDVKTHALSQVSKNGGHGIFDWWQAP